ncbi:hypothetical protein [Sphingomonas sp. GM_Shp_1]|nr:hypothetical protein [Sphingomonas sp. GM_Shp_1]
MTTNPEPTQPNSIPNEDEADSSGAGYGNHGDADEEEQDRREVGG